MKPDKIKILATPVAIAVLAACVSSASAGQNSTANSDPALATAEGFFAALNNADLDALVGTFTCERAPAVHHRAARACSTCAAKNLLQEFRPR